jgi:hypothetical protein
LITLEDSELFRYAEQKLDRQADSCSFESSWRSFEENMCQQTGRPPMRLCLGDPVPGTGWHRAEVLPIDVETYQDMGGQPPPTNRRNVAFRWTGPDQESTLTFPIAAPKVTTVRIRIVQAITQQAVRGLRILIDGKETRQKVRCGEGTNVVVEARRKFGAGRPDRPITRIQIQSGETGQTSSYSRKVGVAIVWAEAH